MKPGGGFENLLRKSGFLKHVISVVFDEAHCISTWGSFRPEYRTIEQLRHVLLKDTPVAVASATLPHIVKQDIINVLQLRRDKLVYISRPTDRPNIHISVRKIKHPLNSYLDLTFVLPKNSGDPPPKFIVFCDTINDAVGAGEALRSRLPPEHCDKIVWFHSEMSDEFKKKQLERLKSGELWGICATDSFGMVMHWPALYTTRYITHKACRGSIYQTLSL